MSTRRADIYAAIVTELEGITILNGFNNDIKTVDDDKLKAPDDLNDEDFPVAYVVDTDESKENADLGNVQATLEFIVAGYVRSGDGFEAIQDKRRSFQQDVERALTADRYQTLGNLGYIVDTLISSIKTDKGMMEPFGLFDMTFVITYWHPYGTP